MPTPNGPRNQPRFDLNDDPDFATDLTSVSDYAAVGGNRKVGTTAERNAASGADVWEGLLWGDTTTGDEYRYTSGAWVLWNSALRTKSGVLISSGSNPSVGSNGYSVCTWSVKNGMCEVAYSVYFGNQTGVGPGTGNWGLRLPTSLPVVGQGRYMLSGYYIRSSGSNFAPVAVFDSGNGTTIAEIYTADGARLPVSNTGAAADRFLLQGVYPVAAAAAG